MNLNRGGVAVPLLFLTLLFIGIYIFNTTLESKSQADITHTYQASDVSNTSNKQNLQLNEIEFTTPTPTIRPVAPTKAPVPTIAQPPQSGMCQKDGWIPFDPSTCQCVGFLYKCVALQAFADGQRDVPDDPLCREHFKDGYYCFSKPVIYLYPQKPTFVTVTLSIPGKITESIPEFEGLNTSEKSFGGWQNVLAMPGGILKYQNSYYHELYYESKVKDVVAPDNGVFLSASNLKQELVVQGEKLGLHPNESLEFADYWFPRLQQLNKPYIFFSILTPQEKERTDKVTIQPTPDNFIEFIAYFKGVDTQFAIKPFIYPKVPQRTGFTAVEWGGVVGD